MKKNALTLSSVAMLAALSCAQPDSPAAATQPDAAPTTQGAAAAPKTTASGLGIVEVAEGKGDVAKAGDSVSVNYTGKLKDGTKFDSSYDRHEPFSFKLGAHEVIPGWDEGIAGMKVGGKRQLIIPPNLGYGERDMGAIPPNSTLYFDVELMGIEK